MLGGIRSCGTATSRLKLGFGWGSAALRLKLDFGWEPAWDGGGGGGTLLCPGNAGDELSVNCD